MIERNDDHVVKHGAGAPDMPEPRQIYQANLDAVDRVLWQETWDELSLHLSTPAVIRMADYEIRVATDADLLAVAQSQRRCLARLGANEYHRICQSADWVGDARDHIVGTHRTYVLQNGKPLLSPYVSTMPLRLHDGRWRATGISTDVANGQLPALSARFGDLSSGKRQP